MDASVKQITKQPKSNDRSPESKKIQLLDKRKVVVVFTIYGHGCHLGHMAWIFYIHIGPPFL